jgi:hypothetical protein
VDKERKLLERVMLKGLWWRSFNLFLLVLGRFNFYGKFLKKGILYMGVGKTPFPLRRCEFNLKDFWELRFSDKLITKIQKVITA